MKIAIINGPNLNMLGKRQTSIYGENSFDDFFLKLKKKYTNLELEYFQSNHEGELIDKIQSIGRQVDGLIVNAGAYTHTSIALRDALLAVEARFVEVHISNIYSRESFRHKSYLTDISEGIISGMGLKGYELALIFLTENE
jgi:3-dehydroquinate dehydratase-2